MAGIILPNRFSRQPQYAVSPAPAYADAEILSLFNDGTGKDAAGNHLIPGVAPTPVIRSHGKALAFNGSTQYLVSTRTVTPTPAFTLFAWVRPTVLNTGYKRILETNYLTGFYLGTNAGSQYAWIVNNSSLGGCTGGQQVIGQRDFVCGVFDGANRILYVNGIQVASDTATAPSAALTLYISKWAAGSGYLWNGDIDTVGVFNRAFPAEEVWSLYQNPWQLFKAPARRLWAVTTGITIDPAGAPSTQANTSSAVAITLEYALAGAAATQGNLGGAGVTSIVSEFIGAASTQANLSGVGRITRIQTLTAVDSTQANPSGTGVISDGIVVESALMTGIAATIRIKKPGIPSGTPEWLKTLLEILIGRRGNRIEVPKFRIITFSATPTKTECEALYSYTNTVRNSLEQLINRMDG